MGHARFEVFAYLNYVQSIAISFNLRIQETLKKGPEMKLLLCYATSTGNASPQGCTL